jgi:hypothetical protein
MEWIGFSCPMVVASTTHPFSARREKPPIDE